MGVINAVIKTEAKAIKKEAKAELKGDVKSEVKANLQEDGRNPTPETCYKKSPITAEGLDF